MTGLNQPDGYIKMPTLDDLSRVEGKVDKLLEAVEKLVIIEERQTRHALDLDQLERRFDLHVTSHSNQVKELEEFNRATREKLNTWIQRGVGAYTTLGILGTVTITLFEMFFHK